MPYGKPDKFGSLRSGDHAYHTRNDIGIHKTDKSLNALIDKSACDVCLTCTKPKCTGTCSTIRQAEGRDIK